MSILVYSYATGMLFSRKLKNATCDTDAFRFVAADEHPGHELLTPSANELAEVANQRKSPQTLRIYSTIADQESLRIAIEG